MQIIKYFTLILLSIAVMAVLMNIVIFCANLYWFLKKEKTFVERIPGPDENDTGKALVNNIFVMYMLILLFPQQILFGFIVDIIEKRH